MKTTENVAPEVKRSRSRRIDEAATEPVTITHTSTASPTMVTRVPTSAEERHRLVAEAGVAAITFHPRSAKVHHAGVPDYDLAAELVASLPAPVILTGGLHTVAEVQDAYERTGAAAVMLARGSLGNPWLFEQLLGRRDDDPTAAEILAEWHWVIDRAQEHLGPERAGRYLRKFYPWSADLMGLTRREREPLVTAPTTDDARRALRRMAPRETARAA